MADRNNEEDGEYRNNKGRDEEDREDEEIEWSAGDDIGYGEHETGQGMPPKSYNDMVRDMNRKREEKEEKKGDLEGEVSSGSEEYRSPEERIEDISEKLLTNDNFNPEGIGKMLSESVRGDMNLAKKGKLLERLREEGVNVPEYRGREVEEVYSQVIGRLASICERHIGENPLESNNECYVEKQTYLFDEL